METHREQFFKIASRQYPDRVYFAPDITDWYVGNHREKDGPLKYGPGEMIPDDDPIRHENQDHLAKEFQDMSLMDFYRKYDWGMHCHIYNWYDTYYTDGVTLDTEINGNLKVLTYHTPIGSLTRQYKLAADGTWAPVDHLMKDCEEDLPIMLKIIESMHFTLRDDLVQEVMKNLGDKGEADVAIMRSPFGKLLHEYLGFEDTIFLLADTPELYDVYVKAQWEKDMELVKLAAQSSADMVIISDHADATLYSPDMYRKYCIPFYRQAGEYLRAHGKFVSTHVDGNLNTLLPLLADSGFDMLDGCTPAPMFDYPVEDLAKALGGKVTAFVGVPSALFCDGTSLEDLCALADRILRAFHGRVVLNVGDIFPANGDMSKLIGLTEYVKNHPMNQELAAGK